MITGRDRNTIKTVEDLVCSYLGVSSDLLHIETKEQDIVDLRQHIIYLTKKFYPRISNSTLGKYFLGRKPSTITQGIAKVDEVKQFDKPYATYLDELSSVVQASLFNTEEDFDKLKQLLIREVIKAEKCSDILPVLRIIVG